jgi:hypothetical protein
MQGLQQSYSQYYNRKHHKTGHVFEGRYKAIICQKDEYLLELIRYIHLNPVRARMVKSPEEHRYSGHHAYLHGKANETIDPGKILAMLGGKAAYRRFVSDGLGEGHKEEYYDVKDQRFLGAEGFVEKLLNKEEPEKAHRPPTRRSIDSVVKEIAKVAGTEVQALRSPDRSWAISKARTLIAYILVRRLGYSLNEVAAYFGRDVATVATLLARMGERMQSDENQMPDIGRFLKIVET